ncbi:sodium/proline symporter PutP [Paenibacillus wynnii]|uniref:Sodium/proline symporter n=1 Tax=Paenibacillus wynnii TaxID=268407 RepID=A0A098MCJ7_9BACL|nr:sodium/proline symporter PutP [Paenibacillus wynnii]KGE19773.1 proline:sodium symporter PutP [Paenibacillus wynnii]
MIVISIVIYMLGMLVIGYFGYKRTSSLSDFMLGGRSLGPVVTALSAGASDMSGWLLLGLPGAMFAQGLSASWIVIGLTLGAYANWLYVAPRLRVFTEVAGNAMTIPEFFQNRFEDRSNILRLVSGIVILVFFTFYVSSGIVSGAVLFNNVLGFEYNTGLWIITGVVVAYTLFGGFLAVSWTDSVQGTLMFLALIIIPVVILANTGSLPVTIDRIEQIDPTLLDLFKGTTFLGIVSLFAWGLGYFGQPHIIIRFMAISSVKEMKKARRIGMGWMIFSICGAMFSGLIAIAYMDKNNISLKDPETVLLELSKLLFHPLIGGLLMAAILSAVMSTISSQLLVTSSSLTGDLYKAFFRRSASERELMLAGRLSVLTVAVVATALAYSRNETILSLVGYAWAGFGSAFGPVVLLSLLWKRMNKWGALAGLIAGSVTVIGWNTFGLSDVLYEMIPGFIAGILAIIVTSLMTQKPTAEMLDTFQEYRQSL